LIVTLLCFLGHVTQAPLGSPALQGQYALLCQVELLWQHHLS